MISKAFSKSGKKCRVTFKFPAEEDVGNVVVLGDFNGWDPKATPLQKRKDGTFSTTLSLEAGSQYRFRYLVDGRRWDNDVEADAYVLNRFGSQDGVLEL